jgi:hypothetical protein
VWWVPEHARMTRLVSVRGQPHGVGELNTSRRTYTRAEGEHAEVGLRLDRGEDSGMARERGEVRE